MKEVATRANRVAARAAEIKVSRVLLTVIASPAYLLGAIVGLLWLAVTWVLAAAQVGFGDVKKSRRVTDGAD